MPDQKELLPVEAVLKKPAEKRTSGLHMDVALYDRAAALADKEGMSTNAVLVQLIEIGLIAVEGGNRGVRK